MDAAAYQLFRQAHNAASENTCRALENTCRQEEDLQQAALLLVGRPPPGAAPPSGPAGAGRGTRRESPRQSPSLGKAVIPAVTPGVSTACLYPMETERALETLLRLGYRRFEVFLNAMEELFPFCGGWGAGLGLWGQFCLGTFTLGGRVHPAVRGLSPPHPRGLRFLPPLPGRRPAGARWVVIHGQPQGHGALRMRAIGAALGSSLPAGKGGGAFPAQENVCASTAAPGRVHRRDGPLSGGGLRLCAGRSSAAWPGRGWRTWWGQWAPGWCMCT